MLLLLLLFLLLTQLLFSIIFSWGILSSIFSMGASTFIVKNFFNLFINWTFLSFSIFRLTLKVLKWIMISYNNFATLLIFFFINWMGSYSALFINKLLIIFKLFEWIRIYIIKWVFVRFFSLKLWALSILFLIVIIVILLSSAIRWL